MLFIVSVVLNVALVTVTAVGNRQLIEAWLCPDVKMEWNGVEFSPTEDNGERVYPIIYNDRTYLPVRFVAEKAGVTVGWDGVNNTVQLGTNGYTYKPSVPETPVVTPSNNYGEITTNVYDFQFLPDSITHLKGRIALNPACEKHIDSNGCWIAEDWSTSTRVSYVFPTLTFEPTNDNDKQVIQDAFNSMCKAIEQNGFTLLKVDGHGIRHYLLGTTEITIWDVGGHHNAMTVEIRTGYQACCID